VLHFQLARFLEECLGDHGEEFRRLARRVRIEKRRLSCPKRGTQAVELCPEHARPFAVRARAAEARRAVHRLVFHVEVMRELVQHHVVAGREPVFDVLPRNDDSPRVPCLARQHPVTFRDHAVTVAMRVWHDERRRIHQDREQVVVEMRARHVRPVADEQAGVGSNHDAHLFRDSQPVAADERLLADEDPDQLLQAREQLRRDACVNRRSCPQPVLPVRRKRLPPERGAPAATPPVLADYEPHGDTYGDRHEREEQQHAVLLRCRPVSNRPMRARRQTFNWLTRNFSRLSSERFRCAPHERGP
jgi:hypothetical protein